MWIMVGKLRQGNGNITPFFFFLVKLCYLSLYFVKVVDLDPILSIFFLISVTTKQQLLNSFN